MTSRTTQVHGRFNMVEVVIALVIGLVALIGILRLVPSGVDASTDAMARRNATDTSERFLNYLASRIEADWTEVEAFPETKPGADAEPSDEAEDWIQLSGTVPGIMFDGSTGVTSWPPATTHTGIFKVERAAEHGGAIDFQGIIRIWKTEVTAVDSLPHDGGGALGPALAATGDSIMVQLYAELSWPASRPYAQRQTAVYTLEVTRRPETVTMSEETPDPPEPDPEEEEAPPEDSFTIEDGQVVLTDDANTTFEHLGCAIVCGSYDCPVTATLTINGVDYPFADGDDINDGSTYSYDAGVITGGATVSVSATSYYPDVYGGSQIITASSSPANQQVLVLEDGDTVPDIEGFAGQDDLESYIQDYIDTDTQTVTLQDNQAIVFFELGTTNMNSSAADFQIGRASCRERVCHRV